MCIGSNSVNQAQDLMTVTKIEDLPNSLLPTLYTVTQGVDYLAHVREQTIWEILEFCYRNQILGLIYRIRADAHGILVFTC